MPTGPLPKGIVNIRFDEYTPLLDMMRGLNAVVYQITDHFDTSRA